MNWESPYLAGLLRALGRHARLIIMDRRGFGCSDRFSPTDIPPFEVFTDDILIVMDAVGSRSGRHLRNVGLRPHRDALGRRVPGAGSCAHSG